MFFCFFFCKQKTAYEMRISDWSSDVCSSDLIGLAIVDRDALVKASENDKHPFCETAKILSACIAYNLFEVRELKQDNKLWTVLYLNRMLCVHFDLVYHTGGWRPTSIARLKAWHQGTPSTIL